MKINFFKLVRPPLRCKRRVVYWFWNIWWAKDGCLSEKAFTYELLLFQPPRVATGNAKSLGEICTVERINLNLN